MRRGGGGTGGCGGLPVDELTEGFRITHLVLCGK